MGCLAGRKQVKQICKPSSYSLPFGISINRCMFTMEGMPPTNPFTPKWYHYPAAFWAGAFLCNVIPHFVNGVSGNPFPTPFADPPGKGLSSPILNVIWALVNLLIGYVLLRASRVSPRAKGLLTVFFLGLALMAVFLALHFVDKTDH